MAVDTVINYKNKQPFCALGHLYPGMLVLVVFNS